MGRSRKEAQDSTRCLGEEGKIKKERSSWMRACDPEHEQSLPVDPRMRTIAREHPTRESCVGDARKVKPSKRGTKRSIRRRRKGKTRDMPV